MEREQTFYDHPKREIEEILDDLALKGELKQRKEILKYIKKQDAELAHMERRLIDMSSMVVIMTVGALTRMITTRLINRYISE